jgi:hypothetical protein
MAETAIQDIKDFHDIIHLLEEHPEWRADLRRVLLTDDLLDLPHQVGHLVNAQTHTEAQIAELAVAQHRTVEQVTMLTSQVDGLARQMTTLTAQVAELTEVQRRTETQLVAVTDNMRRMGDDLGALKGRDLEHTYREKAAVYFDTVIQDPHALSFADLYSLLDDATRRGVLSPGERRNLARADSIVGGKQPQTGQDCYLVIEVSWGVRSNDVERAAQRATFLRKLGVPVLAVVAGEGISPEAHREAVERGVWQVIDGTAVPPNSADRNV